MGCLDVLLIVHGIKMSLVCPVLRRKWVRPLWLYRHGYIIVGMSVCLGVLLCEAICLFRVNKVVVNTVGFGIG